ncbi:MAG: hypothetical protein U9R17_01340 [Thermodesulfobacteriota bacterium]|nr:hypothetical protein [Thermodesulfobacteriota bacterium]
MEKNTLKSKSFTPNGINAVQIIIGVVGLIIGSLVYITDRSPEEIYFINRLKIPTDIFQKVPNLFGLTGNSLPDLLHVFSFILITAGLLSNKKKWYIIICLGWFFLDIAFELGQKFKSWPVSMIPDWFQGVPFLENSKNYFQGGAFDIYDIVAIAVGTVMAYFVLLITKKEDI